jgi:hypothetical protein
VAAVIVLANLMASPFTNSRLFVRVFTLLSDKPDYHVERPWPDLCRPDRAERPAPGQRQRPVDDLMAARSAGADRMRLRPRRCALIIGRRRASPLTLQLRQTCPDRWKIIGGAGLSQCSLPKHLSFVARQID